MLEGHEEVEDALLEAGFRGSQIVNGQGLLLPARGAYDSEGLMIDGDEIPAEAAERRGLQRLFEGLCLAVEKSHAGNLADPVATSGAAGQFSKITRRGRTVEFRQSSSGFKDRHPDIWRKARAARLATIWQSDVLRHRPTHELELVKASVEPLFFQQLRVRAFLAQPAVVEDQDPVGPLHGAQAMGDD